MKSQISCFFFDISYHNLENQNHCDYVSKIFYENILQKYWQFSVCNNLFHIFWMHGLKKFHCGSLFVLFEILSNFDGNLSNPHISFFFIGISYRNLESKNHCDYVSQKFYENIFQKYWELSLCKKLFHIF